MRLLAFAFAFAVAAAVASLAAGLASARPTSFASFRTPSANIGCVYSSAESGLQASIRCDIRSGLKPKPSQPARCNLDYGDSFAVPKKGAAVVVCHGDTALDPHARVLRYGTFFRRDGFTCSSKPAGLRCSNTVGHGFFMSRAHSYRF